MVSTFDWDAIRAIRREMMDANISNPQWFNPWAGDTRSNAHEVAMCRADIDALHAMILAGPDIVEPNPKFKLVNARIRGLPVVEDPAAYAPMIRKLDTQWRQPAD